MIPTKNRNGKVLGFLSCVPMNVGDCLGHRTSVEVRQTLEEPFSPTACVSESELEGWLDSRCLTCALV